MIKIKVILTAILMIFLCAEMGFCADTQALKGGVYQEYIPKGFFGSWGVISKLDATNNPSVFNSQSRDIWVLSGYSNILILENLESGAKSEIEIKDKSIDGATLRFSRTKEVKNLKGKTIYREIIEFKLAGDNFSGTDRFVVEHYNSQNTLLNKDDALYNIAGVRISGE